MPSSTRQTIRPLLPAALPAPFPQQRRGLGGVGVLRGRAVAEVAAGRADRGAESDQQAHPGQDHGKPVPMAPTGKKGHRQAFPRVRHTGRAGPAAPGPPSRSHRPGLSSSAERRHSALLRSQQTDGRRTTAWSQPGAGPECAAPEHGRVAIRSPTTKPAARCGAATGRRGVATPSSSGMRLRPRAMPELIPCGVRTPPAGRAVRGRPAADRRATRPQVRHRHHAVRDRAPAFGPGHDPDVRRGGHRNAHRRGRSRVGIIHSRIDDEQLALRDAPAPCLSRRADRDLSGHAAPGLTRQQTNPQAADLGVSHGAGDENRTRALSLGSDGARRAG